MAARKRLAADSDTPWEDWMLELPEELAQQFKDEIYRFEEDRRMPYVSSVERLARKEGRDEGLQAGRQEGREEGIKEGLKRGRTEARVEALRESATLALTTKFGVAGRKLVPKLSQLRDPATIRDILTAVISAEKIDDVRALLQ
jgi:flagellar biosynthesis/type III secretory pathway protein FliH